MKRIAVYGSGALLFVLLCGLLNSDQTRYLPWLKDYAEQSPTPQFSWYAAAFQGDAEARAKLLQSARSQHQRYWLRLLVQLGSTDALYQLASHEPLPEVRKELFARAAAKGHANSQYELSLLSESSSAKLLWLQKAATEKHLLAQIALYQWHLLHNQLEQALPWLRLSAEQDADSARLLAKYLWKQDEHAEAKQAFHQAVTLGDEEAANLLTLINEHWKRPVQVTSTNHSDSLRSACNMHIQFVANSLESMAQATTIRQQFFQDPRLAELPVCIAPPVWVEELECSDNWKRQRRLGCDIEPLISLAEYRDFSHVAVFAEQGKANVHNGIMYLDLADTYSVFVHELAHFAGFVDEYPLSSQMASIHCYGKSAPNVMVSANGEVPAVTDMTDWVSEAVPVSLSKTRTCNNHPAQAYKPTNELTFMEYHDQGAIPPLYVALWKRQLLKPANLTPVYVNFAQLLRERGRQQEADTWWKRFTEYIQADTL